MAKVPVALQACLNPKDGTTQALPARFNYGGAFESAAVSGRRGWIPLPILMESAASVGFVDFSGPAIPLVEKYQGRPCKSLIVCCLEFASGATAHVEAERRVIIGNDRLPIDASGFYHADLSHEEPLKVISFARLAAGLVGKEEIAGRVVIIGLDSTRGPTIPSEYGRIGVHRFFIQCLAACYRALQIDPSAEPISPRRGGSS